MYHILHCIVLELHIKTVQFHVRNIYPNLILVWQSIFNLAFQSFTWRGGLSPTHLQCKIGPWLKYGELFTFRVVFWYIWLIVCVPAVLGTLNHHVIWYGRWSSCGQSDHVYLNACMRSISTTCVDLMLRSITLGAIWNRPHGVRII